MAGTIKGITVEINGSTTGLKNALKDVDSKSRELADSLKAVNKALKLDPTNTQLLSEKQKILKESISATKEKLASLESVQQQISDQYAAGEIDRGAYLAFQKELEFTKNKLENLIKMQDAFGSAIQQKMEAAGQKVSEFGGKVEKLGGTLTKGVTAPLTAVGGAAMAAFGKVDDGIDIIVKATGASGEALDDLGASYKKVASEMPAEFQTVAEAIGEVNTRFHTTGEALEKQTELIIQFADITGGDVISATDNADKALKAFNMTQNDLAGYLGLVASKSQETGISAQSLMQDVVKNSSAFKALGFNLEESINLMAQMDANGVDVSTALAGLKKSVTNLTDAGMSESDALRQVIEDIKNAQTETKALELAQETFGTKGAAEMAAAIREGRLDIDDLATSMADCASVVGDTFANTVGDASDEAKIAMNAVTVAGAELGSTMSTMAAPIIMQVAELIRGLTQKLSGLSDGQKETIVKIGLVVAAIGPALTVGGKLISGIGTTISALGKLGSVFSFLAANPVVLIVAAIAGLVTIFVTAYNKCEWFRDGVNSVIQNVKEVWSSSMTAISEVVNARLSKMRSAYEENGGGMRGIAAATMEGIRGCYEDGWNIVDKLTGGKLTNIKNAIQEKMNSAKDAVSQAIEKIKGVFNFEWKWPPLKLPHFTISGSFSLNPPSIPKIGVSWYAKGGILNAPTIFGSMGGKLLGGGEAGQEAVLPLSDFYSNLDSIMGKYLRGRTGMLVELNIEHFENNSDRDVDALADQVAERIDHKIQKEGAVFA